MTALPSRYYTTRFDLSWGQHDIQLRCRTCNGLPLATAAELSLDTQVKVATAHEHAHHSEIPFEQTQGR